MISKGVDDSRIPLQGFADTERGSHDEGAFLQISVWETFK